MLVLNLEDGNDSLADRVIGEQTGFGASRVRKLDFAKGDYDRIKLASQEPLLQHVFVSEGLYDVEDFAKAVVSHHRRRKIALVISDYLQLQRIKGVKEPTQRMAEVMLVQAKLAKYIGAPVLALSQLTQKKVMDRGAEQYFKAKAAGVEGDERYEGFAPISGDFHWASEVDQFAKMILAFHRPGPYRRQMERKPDKDTRGELRMIKSNHTPSDRYTVGWDGPLTRAYDLSVAT